MAGGIRGSTSAVPKSGSSTSASLARPVVVVMRPSWPTQGQRRRGLRAAGDADDLVGGYVDPRAHDAVWPRDADPRGDGRSEPDVDRTELATGMPATDRQLAMDGPVADRDVEPGADRVGVRAGLRDTDRGPVAHRH